MVVVDLASAAAVLLLLGVTSADRLWLVYVVALLYGASLAVFQSARSALVHQLLPAELLDAGNAALATVREALRLVGPVAGAGLYVAFGGGATAVLDAATFLASAGCLLAVRTREPRPPRRTHGPRRRLWTELAAGARHLRDDLVLRRLVPVLVAVMAVTGLAESGILQVVTVGLGRSPAFLGVVGLVQGAGAVVGGLTATPACRRLGESALVGAGLVLAAVGAALETAHSGVPVLVGVAAFGAALPWVSVGFVTALQRRTPARLQGRTYSAADAVLTVPQVASIAAGAALVAVVDYRLLFVAMASVYAVAAVVLLAGRRRPASVALPDLLDGVEPQLPGDALELSRSAVVERDA
jgi:hypothetical protein